MDNLFQGETGVRATRHSTMSWRSSGVCARDDMSTPRSANPYFRENKRGFFLKCVLPRVEKIRVNVPLIEVNEELYVVKGNV